MSGGTNGVALDASSGRAYAVTNSTVGGWCSRPVGVRADQLSIVDLRAGKLIATSATGRGPVWPLVDPPRRVVYVASSDGEVVVHDIATGVRLGSIAVGGLPHDLGLDPASGLLLVSNTNDGSQEYIAVVDASSRKVVRHLRVSKFPHRISVDPEEQVAYVMSVESGHVTVVDTAQGTVIRVIETGGGGTMAYSRATGLLFVPNRGPGPETVRAIEAKTGRLVGVVGPFLSQAGHQAFGLAVDDGRGLLFAALGDSDLVGVADIRALEALGVFTATDCVWGVQVDPATGLGVVSGVTQGSVAIFSLDDVAELVRRR
jgi:YVTN family beta-propeller protein